MNRVRFFKQLERLGKKIVPPRLQPLFTPLKQAVMPKKYNRLTGIWFITWTCNFRCPYCWQREAPETYRRRYPVTAGDWLAAWQRIADAFDEIVLGISGGEPFAVKGFLDLLARLPDNIHYDITSNLSFKTEEFLAIDRVRRNCVGVVCSFHPTSFPDPTAYIERFSRQVRALRALPHTRINFVAAPPNLTYYPVVRSLADSLQVPLHVDRYAPLGAGLPFSEEERLLAEQIVSKDRGKDRQAETRPVRCNGGVSHLTLLPDGNAYPCLNKAEQGRKLVGSFIDPGFRCNREWLPCATYPRCAGCDLDNIRVRPL